MCYGLGRRCGEEEGRKTAKMTFLIYDFRFLIGKSQACSRPGTEDEGEEEDDTGAGRSA